MEELQVFRVGLRVDLAQVSGKPKVALDLGPSNASAYGCFCKLGGPSCGRPLNESPTILGSY